MEAVSEKFAQKIKGAGLVDDRNIMFLTTRTLFPDYADKKGRDRLIFAIKDDSARIILVEKGKKLCKYHVNPKTNPWGFSKDEIASGAVTSKTKKDDTYVITLFNKDREEIGIDIQKMLPEFDKFLEALGLSK